VPKRPNNSIIHECVAVCCNVWQCVAVSCNVCCGVPKTQVSRIKKNIFLKEKEKYFS